MFRLVKVCIVKNDKDPQQVATATELPNQVEELQKAVSDYKNSLQRLQADFENYKKRADKDSMISMQHAKSNAVKVLLPVLDSFEMALKNSSDKEKFVKGIEMIYAQFYSALEELGLKRINALGKLLDPYKHEVLLQEQSDKDGIVLEELQRGYMLNDTVLRYVKVKVGKKSEVKSEN